MKEDQDPRIRVLVVWEPVLRSDIGLPASSVLALTSVDRATQFWDEQRALSEFMVNASIYVPSLAEPGVSVAPGFVVMDQIVVFPPGSTWGAHPQPTYYGGPVIHVMDKVRSALGAPAP